MASVELAIDLGVFPLAAVHRAAYELAARADIALGCVTGAILPVRLTARDSAAEESLAAAFHRRLVDLALQLDIQARTSGVREALTRAALMGSASVTCEAPNATPLVETRDAPTAAGEPRAEASRECL